MRNICGTSMSMINGHEENLQPLATPHLQILGDNLYPLSMTMPPQGFLQKSGVGQVEQTITTTLANSGRGKESRLLWLCLDLPNANKVPNCDVNLFLHNNINAMSKLFHILMLNLTSSHSHLATLHLIVCQLGFSHLFCFPPVYLAALHQQCGEVNQIAVCQPRCQWFANEMFLINLRPPPRPSRLTLKHTGNVDPQICCRILSECVRS